MKPPVRTATVRTLLLLPATAALLGALGCGGGSFKTVPVSGKVTLNERPLPKGTVTFHPDASKGNTSKQLAVGNINDSGDYTVGTGKQSGAIAGWYKVSVTCSVPTNPKDPYSPTESLIPDAYTSETNTPLSVEVKAGAAAGHYDLKLSK